MPFQGVGPSELAHDLQVQLYDNEAGQALNGNVSGTVSHHVAKKISQEARRIKHLPLERALAKDKDTRKDVQAVIEEENEMERLSDSRQGKMKGYCRDCSVNPFSMVLCRAGQIDTWNRLCSQRQKGRGAVSAHFDGTFGVVRRTYPDMHHDKRPQNYSLVLSRPGVSKCFPVLDFVKTEQATKYVCPTLIWFKSTSEERLLSGQKRDTICPDFLVTDNCPVAQESLCLAINGMTIQHYNDWTWWMWCRKKCKEEIKGISIVRLCAAHGMHLLSTHLKKENAETETWHRALASFALLLDATTVDEAVSILQSMILVFGSP